MSTGFPRGDPGPMDGCGNRGQIPIASKSRRISQGHLGRRLGTGRLSRLFPQNGGWAVHSLRSLGTDAQKQTSLSPAPLAKPRGAGFLPCRPQDGPPLINDLLTRVSTDAFGDEHQPPLLNLLPRPSGVRFHRGDLERHGQGRVRESKNLSVKIPAGVDNGDRVRLSGEGEAGVHGGPAGDLYVQVSVKKHSIFEREGQDLYCDVPISFVTAAMGGSIEVPTLEGRVTLKIPAETQTGKSFRVRGKGLKSIRGNGVGDLLCRVGIETPVNLSREQKDLLTQLQDSLDNDKHKHSPRSHTWFDGVKKFFEDMKF